MPTIYIGCAGWLYEDWKGAFYPYELEPHNYLPYYSKFFNIIEINTTFYNLPTKATVKNWYERVPPDFLFIIKMWQEITHKLNNPDIGYLLTEFFNHMEALQKKIHAYLFQFPPWLNYSQKHLDQINNLIRQSPPEYIYVIELRHNSWFKADILNQISDGERIIIGTSYLEDLFPYYKPNQNRYYIRLIGDRQLSIFNRVQREKKDEYTQLIQKIRNLKKKPNIYEIFIIVNNHYTGFAPETANLLKKDLSLPFRSFTQQKKMSDYI